VVVVVVVVVCRGRLWLSEWKGIVTDDASKVPSEVLSGIAPNPNLFQRVTTLPPNRTDSVRPTSEPRQNITSFYMFRR